jgi:general nucleoside transport system permease protein
VSAARKAGVAAIAQAGRVLLLFGALASGFFLLIGHHPGAMFIAIAQAAAGSGYAIGESLLRATPILLCALATLVPARLGLISVGAEGQLYLGAIAGTGVMLAWSGPQVLLLPAVLLGGMVGGALWALLPALLRNAAGVNETISTLMLNYVAALTVTWLVYGPWKNPQSQGWPATAEFPGAARLGTLADSRVHAGLLLALGIAALLAFLLDRTRWGLALDVLHSNPRLEHVTGLSIARQVLLTMSIGGALAGLAGIAEASAVQGRLQSDLSLGAGLSGFLVAWLAGNRVGRTVWMSLLVGGLLASGDGLQMSAQVPSSVTLVVQGLLFVAVLGAGTRWRTGQGARRV